MKVEVRVPFIAGLLAFALSACATSQLARRASAISAADEAAKRALADENRLDPGKIPPRSVAVVPFVVAERDTLLHPLGYGLADLLTSDLARTSSLQMVERLRMEAILRELALIDNGVTDPRGAPRVGKLMGARRIVIGDVASGPGGNVVVRARVVDVISGTVATLVSAQAPLSRIIDAEKELALRVIAELGVTLTPAERTGIEGRQAVQASALVAYGRGLEAETRGDASAAIAAFEEASRIDPSFAAARVQVAGGANAAAAPKGGGAQRLLDATTAAINAPVATRIPEAADAPLSSSVITLLLTIRVF